MRAEEDGDMRSYLEDHKNDYTASIRESHRTTYKFLFVFCGLWNVLFGILLLFLSVPVGLFGILGGLALTAWSVQYYRKKP